MANRRRLSFALYTYAVPMYKYYVLIVYRRDMRIRDRTSNKSVSLPSRFVGKPPRRSKKADGLIACFIYCLPVAFGSISPSPLRIYYLAKDRYPSFTLCCRCSVRNSTNLIVRIGFRRGSRVAMCLYVR